MNCEPKPLKISLLVAAVMLCITVVPTVPYGFYAINICGLAAYGAFKLKDSPTLSGNFIPLIIMAVLFNPLRKEIRIGLRTIKTLILGVS